MPPTILTEPTPWTSFEWDLDDEGVATHVLEGTDCLADHIVACDNYSQAVEQFAKYLFQAHPNRPFFGPERREALVSIFAATLERLDRPPTPPNNSGSSNDPKPTGPVGWTSTGQTAHKTLPKSKQSEHKAGPPPTPKRFSVQVPIPTVSRP